MSKVTYYEKLLDPRWQKVRLEKLSNSEFKCEKCGCTEKTLHVHHKQYFKGREPWEYSLYELVTLCATCHESEHDIDDLFKQVLCLLQVDGPFNKNDAYWLMAGFVGLGVEPPLELHKDLYKHGRKAYEVCNGKN